MSCIARTEPQPPKSSLAPLSAISLSTEVPLHPSAVLTLGNPDDRMLDNVPKVCRKNLVLSAGDFDSRYRFVSFERALVVALSHQLPADVLPGISSGQTTIVGPVSLSKVDLPSNITTRVNPYEALVSAIESRAQAQIVTLELLGRPEGDDGKRVILVRYVVQVLSATSEVARLGSARVTLCLMPEKSGSITAYLENVIQS